MLASLDAGGYNDEYKHRMRTMTRTLTAKEANAPPFVGLSLAQWKLSNVLTVDGLYKDGPAYQTGIRIGDKLLSIAGTKVQTISEVRCAINKYCHCSRLTKFTLQRPVENEDQ
uniref:PDZ and LIM domain protein 5 n=1 Tax=Lygus hesperus TaxID=30085 RepID=A0A0A9W705_LYGHE